MQVADSESVLKMASARRRARELKKMSQERDMKERNMELARREIKAVQGGRAMQELYSEKRAGRWVRNESRVVGGTGGDGGVAISDSAGRTDVKSRWEIRGVEAERSVGTHLDVEAFIGYDVVKAGGKTLDEKNEERAIGKLIKKMEELEGKKIRDVEFHKKDFSVGGMRTLLSRDGSGNSVRYKKGQRVVKAVADGKKNRGRGEGEDKGGEGKIKKDGNLGKVRGILKNVGRKGGRRRTYMEGG